MSENKEEKVVPESDDFTLPLTFGERLEKLDTDEIMSRSPDDPKWFAREYNDKKKDADEILWSAPADARFQQTKMGRFCSEYYVDYQRCRTLLGEDYKPCKFFYNTYTDICPSFWVEKFDEWRDNGIFPAHFNR